MNPSRRTWWVVLAAQDGAVATPTMKTVSAIAKMITGITIRTTHHRVPAETHSMGGSPAAATVARTSSRVKPFAPPERAMPLASTPSGSGLPPARPTQSWGAEGEEVCASAALARLGRYT